MHVFFHLTNHSYHHSFYLKIWDLISFIIIQNLLCCWLFGMSYWFTFSYIMCFYIKICSSVVNLLLGDFSHLKSFHWIILCSLRTGDIIYQFSTEPDTYMK
jgi:hypothetical protein